MDDAAINELRIRAKQATASAATYRDLAERHRDMRDFYRALSFTYGRAAREMRIMLDTFDRVAARTMPEVPWCSSLDRPVETPWAMPTAPQAA